MIQIVRIKNIIHVLLRNMEKRDTIVKCNVSAGHGTGAREAYQNLSVSAQKHLEGCLDAINDWNK